MKPNKFKAFTLTYLLFLGLIYSYSAKAQTETVDTLVHVIENFSDQFLNRHQDTSYIGNYRSEIAIKLQALGKFNYITLKDQSSETSVKYIPVRDLRIGVGFAYKYTAVDLNIGLGLSKNSQIEDFKSFDVRARVYTSKQYVNTFLQFYQGYRISEQKGIDLSPDYSLGTRSDLRSIHMGFQYLYAVNYNKFSLKAPFVFNETQRKSAGSFLFGANFNILIIDADSSLAAINTQGAFGNELHLHDLNNLSLGINAGYMFTYVFKENFFATFSLIPGVIYNNGDYAINERKSIPTQFNARLKTMNSIGYNSRRFFTGLTFEGEGYWIKIADNQRTEITHGLASVFVGYRFKGKN